MVRPWRYITVLRSFNTTRPVHHSWGSYLGPMFEICQPWKNCTDRAVCVYSYPSIRDIFFSPLRIVLKNNHLWWCYCDARPLVADCFITTTYYYSKTTLKHKLVYYTCISNWRTRHCLIRKPKSKTIFSDYSYDGVCRSGWRQCRAARRLVLLRGLSPAPCVQDREGQTGRSWVSACSGLLCSASRVNPVNAAVHIYPAELR